MGWNNVTERNDGTEWNNGIEWNNGTESNFCDIKIDYRHRTVFFNIKIDYG